MLSVAQSMNHDSQANTTSTNNDSSKPNNTDKTHTVSHKKYEIGDFIIEHKLGQGGFGKVFLATHKHTLEPVAIKLINKTVINNNIQLQCIQNEINIHKRLYHEAIVRHYCVLETHSTISMVTEYCPNGELFDYISRHKRLDEKDACRLFQQLISGLYYMHQQSIAHRDIKLDNLLLTSNNQLKIADFGLSKYYTNTLSTLCGSPCYVAPEIINGQQYTGEAIDVWSSGVVLYAMLCGHLPFYDENKAVLFDKIKKADYSLPSLISESGKSLIKELLNLDPLKRISISEIYHHPWFNFLNYNLDNIISPGLSLTKDIIPIDVDLIDDLVIQCPYKKADIIQSLLLNKHNDYTLVYYLHLNKKIRNGNSSISDISSTSIPFKNYMLSKTSKLIHFSNNLYKAIEFYIRSIAKKISVKGKQKEMISNKQVQLSFTSNAKSLNNKKKTLKQTAQSNTLSSSQNASSKNKQLGEKSFFKSNLKKTLDYKTKSNLENAGASNRISRVRNVIQPSFILQISTLIINSNTNEANNLIINESEYKPWKNQKILQPISHTSVNDQFEHLIITRQK